MKSILVLGSSGLLGSELISGQYFKKFKIISHSLSSKADYNLDLENESKLTKMLNQIRPDLIVNLVGLTNVDRCEEYPSEAYRLNVKTVQNIVNCVKNNLPGCFLIHISTDQVYDNQGLSKENNINLTNYYAFSKFCGELIASQVKSAILRTNFFGKSKVLTRSSLTDWLYTELSKGNNINVFEDIWFNPLSMKCLCHMIELVAAKKIEGVFNLGSNGGLNKADFAIYFSQTLNISNSTLTKIKVSDTDFLNAYRPKNMMMNVKKFENEFDIKLPELKEEIKLIIKEYL